MASFGTISVLILDDSAHMRQLLKAMLRKVCIGALSNGA